MDEGTVQLHDPANPYGFAPKPRGCEGCPAQEHGVGFVPGVAPTDIHHTGIVFLGQGPGRQEAERSLPFYEWAPSGKMLTRWLHKCGLPRTRVAIGNVVQCWLPTLPPAARRRVPVEKWGNREPTRAEQEFCYAHHVHPWLTSLQGVVHVVAVGLSAGRFLVGRDPRAGFERFVGTTLQIDLPKPKPCEVLEDGRSGVAMAPADGAGLERIEVALHGATEQD